jgi:hypothetical protein
VPPDAGVSDAVPVDMAIPDTGPPPPLCSEYGQTCTTVADCCNAVPCTSGFCVYPIQ